MTGWMSEWSENEWKPTRNKIVCLNLCNRDYVDVVVVRDGASSEGKELEYISHFLFHTRRQKCTHGPLLVFLSVNMKERN